MAHSSTLFKTLLGVVTAFTIMACQAQETDATKPEADAKTTDQSAQPQRKSPPILGKGPGMGHDYQKNTPSTGNGKPNYRGGRGESEIQPDKSTPKVKESEVVPQKSKHRQTEEELTPDTKKTESGTDNKPAKQPSKSSKDTLDQPG